MNRWIRGMAAGWIGMWLVGGGALTWAEEPGVQAQAGAEGTKLPTAEELAEAQAAMQGMMVPMMGQMMSVMLEAMAETLARVEIAENLATFARNYYQALLARGFSPEEAMRIVSSVGFPSAGGK